MTNQTRKMLQAEALQTTSKATTATLSYNNAIIDGAGREAYKFTN